MKIIIFSTDTKHHTYFINRISEYYDVCSVIYERKKIVKDYDTGPFWEKEVDEFEEVFFEEVDRVLTVNKKMIEITDKIYGQPFDEKASKNCDNYVYNLIPGSKEKMDELGSNQY